MALSMVSQVIRIHLLNRVFINITGRNMCPVAIKFHSYYPPHKGQCCYTRRALMLLLLEGGNNEILKLVSKRDAANIQ